MNITDTALALIAIGEDIEIENDDLAVNYLRGLTEDQRNVTALLTALVVVAAQDGASDIGDFLDRARRSLVQAGRA